MSSQDQRPPPDQAKIYEAARELNRLVAEYFSPQLGLYDTYVSPLLVPVRSEADRCFMCCGAKGFDLPTLRNSLGLDNEPAREARKEIIFLEGAEGLIPHPDVRRVWLRVPRCVALADCRACGAVRGKACRGDGTHPSRDPSRDIRISKSRSEPFRFGSEAFVPHPSELSWWVRVHWSVLESGCEYCGVDKGRPCVSKSGAIVSWTHVARRKASSERK